MEKDSVVSVITCCYNGREHLDNCMGSLLNQTYKKLQVIFIDDGSTDGSFEFAKRYTNRFSSQGATLLCLSQANTGAGGAAANGLLWASGDFIMCFDVDDYLYSESIRKMRDYLVAYPEDALVRTNGFIVAPKGNEKTRFVSEMSEMNNKDIFEDLLLGRTNNWAGSYMVRANALWAVYPDHRIPESRYGQNLQILMAAAWQNKAGFIDEPLMEYRFNPLSFTNIDHSFDGSYDRLQGYKRIRMDILEKMSIKDREIWNKLDIAYSSLLLDLCIRHRKKAEYLEQYARLNALETPSCVYQYYYHLYSGHRFLSLVFRVACSKIAGQVFRFGIVGIIATALHYGLYLGLKKLIPITFAYIIGYGLSFVANYFLTALFTFRKKTSVQTGMGFLGAHLFNLALQTCLLNLFIYWGVNSSWAPVPVFVIAVPINFLLVRFVFKGKEKIFSS